MRPLLESWRSGRLELGTASFAARMVALVLLVSVAKRLVSLQTLLRFTAPSTRPARLGPLGETQVLRAARWVSGAAVMKRWTSCLERTLVAHHYLSRLAVPSLWIAGVCRENATLRAHAWVTVDGEPLGEPPDSLQGFIPILVSGSRARLDPAAPSVFVREAESPPSRRL